MLDNYIFVDEEYLDRSEYIIATFEVEAQEGHTLESVSRTIAYDPTIGTWTTVRGIDNEDLLTTYSGKVLLPLPRAQEKKGRIRVAIPLAVVNPTLGGIPHLLAILGAPFGLQSIRTIQLANIQFPSKFVQAFTGPRYGIAGIYERAGLPVGRPLLATMLKPRSGFTADAYADMAYRALVGGVDIIFDDELMVSPQSAPFAERVPKVKEAVLKACQKTKCAKMYAVNVTGSLKDLAERALQAKELGADCLYFNPLAAGYSGLEILAGSEEINLPVLCCRSMHGIFHRGRNGIDKFVLLKIARILGADGMHIGSISGKLPHRLVGDEDEVKARAQASAGRVRNLKPMVPILSGGMHPGNVEWNVKRLGHSVIIQAGSGVLGHPDGPQAGGKAMRDVVDALVQGNSTLEASRRSRELRTALEKWGYADKGEVKNV